MPEKIELSSFLPGTTPEQLYRAWLDGEMHGAFTGSAAQVDPQVGGRFTAWDSYITGTNLILEPFRRIVQSWRTTEFPAGSPDSHLEVLLEEGEAGTTLRLVHTEIPDGQAEDYRQGWEDYYFEPMQDYFAA
ncbi:MAG TPA: SRPBCC family protein [Anaerolineales bacterium]